MKQWTLVIILYLSACTTHAAHAVSWEALNSEQRAVLVEYEQEWAHLDNGQQQRLALGATRWLGMKRAERKKMQQRFQR